jgi:hypothetical protein
LEKGNASSVGPELVRIFDPMYVMSLNVAHRRDIESVLPYLESHLLRDLDVCASRVVYSYQAGFFPYMARTLHPKVAFHFVDACGLTEPGIASLKDQRRVRVGLAAHSDILGTLSGSQRSFSEYVLGKEPSLIYLLGQLNQQQISRFMELGYKVSWSKPGGTILIRPR